MQSLCLVDLALSQFPGISLDRILIIGSQHILPTTLSMFEYLFKLGLKPENVKLIGKCYSTNPETYKQMQKSGIEVCPSSKEFDSQLSFDQTFSLAIFKFLVKQLFSLNLDNYDKIILMDDGGQLITAAHTLIINNDKIVGIEQTSAGYEKLKNQNLKFPVINVARSKTKLIHESPIVAKVSVEKILSQLWRSHLYPKKVLVIGNGSIGHEIYNHLKTHFETYIYDINQSQSDISLQNFENSLKHFDMIVGCTGTTSLFPYQLSKLKKNAILVSVSSSDREFDAVYLRKSLPLYISCCHETIHANDLYLLNCGFPINFDQDYQTVDGKKFQLTRSLLTTAILQGIANTLPPGLFELDQQIQDKITTRLFTRKRKSRPHSRPRRHRPALQPAI